MARTKQTARRSGGRVVAPSIGPTSILDKVEEDSRIPAGSKTEYKRVDEVYDTDNGKWILRDAAPYSAAEEEDGYRDFCFIIKRKWEYNSTRSTTTFVIKSQALKDTLQEIIGTIPAVSWNVPQVNIDPKVLITFYVPLLEHLKEINLTPMETDSVPAEAEDTEKAVLPSVADQLKLLLDFITNEYSATLRRFDSLITHGEITFDLLWALFLPGLEYYMTDDKTGQPRAVILKWATEQCGMAGPYYSLDCEYVETFGNATNPEHQTASSTGSPKKRFGRAKYTGMISSFQGAVKIHSLRIFPLHMHPRAEEIRTQLIERGKKWAALDGMHHKHYSGIAYLDLGRRVYVNSRVMVDKATFRRIRPNWGMMLPKGSDEDYDSDEDEYRYNGNDDENQTQLKALREAKAKAQKDELSEDEYVLATPTVYGFALGDKQWVEMDVTKVVDFEWNEEAFANLVLPAEKKQLIQALVEAHSYKRVKFDDFIKGKGQGLVINLFGPPGVGKTMSAEATSEHVRKPLYVVGAGDLGTVPTALDSTLDEIFDIAHTWGAVVLIDEADVFLEQRSVRDVTRNALVAVFLRQLEYFAGILFLTTNRIKTFDEAFQSRIHVALRYTDLEETSRTAIWKAFLHKVDVPTAALTETQWADLSKRSLNGRQIKNSVRTAQALAASVDQPLGFKHIVQVLDVIAQFESDLRDLAN